MAGPSAAPRHALCVCLYNLYNTHPVGRETGAARGAVPVAHMSVVGASLDFTASSRDVLLLFPALVDGSPRHPTGYEVSYEVGG